MQYQSTRGASLGRFSDILLQGLAPDGGLAMPEHIPAIITAKNLREWKTLSYADLAFAVMRHYIDDIPENDLRRILHRSYHESVFHSEAITPLTRLGDSDTYILELSNGPSLAFKDIAMQFLGNAMEYVLEARDQRRHRLRRRIRHARRSAHQRLHALAAWPHEPLPAGTNVQPARREHPQHRHRRRL